MVPESRIILIAIGVIIGVMTAILVKNKNIRVVLNVISTIAFVLLIVVAIQKLVHNDNRFLTGYIYQMTSDSMANVLKTNDYIFIMNTKNYKEGDIVTFIREDRVVTHRIVKINGDKIITKGDANFKEDDYITKDKILGKVMLHGIIFNAFVSYLCFVIIAFTMTYLVAQLIPNYKSLEQTSY